MDLTKGDFWIAIGVAMVCGGIVGLERQLRGKPAGIRTSILICLGTTIFVKLSTIFDVGAVDQTRVLGQVVTGIGFLGAGVILARGGHIKGLTSAAVIWMLAGIGSMIGLGLWASAVTLAGITVAILTIMEYLELHILRLRREERIPPDLPDSRKE